jgi:hypothetical protein
MEQLQMAIVGNLLDNDGQLPEEFAPFCNLTSRVEYPRHWSKFKYRHESGVMLYGEPDEIFNASDGSIVVVDHKSARYKGGDDPFLPCYRIQVIGYSNIAELGLELGEVSKGGLFYWEIDDDAVKSDPAKFYRDEKLWAPISHISRIPSSVECPSTGVRSIAHGTSSWGESTVCHSLTTE